MPGPLAGNSSWDDHRRCQQGYNCKGAGCVVSTGKTLARRLKKKIRDLGRIGG